MKRIIVGCSALMIFASTGVSYAKRDATRVIPLPTPTSIPTLTPKSYVRADWLSVEENNLLQSATVLGGHVSISLGDQTDYSECITVPEVMICLFKRYQQAHTFTIWYSCTGANKSIDYTAGYNLKSQTLYDLPIPGVGGRSYLSGKVTREQIRAVAAGRLNFEQIGKSLSERNTSSQEN